MPSLPAHTERTNGTPTAFTWSLTVQLEKEGAQSQRHFSRTLLSHAGQALALRGHAWATPWPADSRAQGDKFGTERVCFSPGINLRPAPMRPRNPRAGSKASSTAGSAARAVSWAPNGSGVQPAALRAGLSSPEHSGAAGAGDGLLPARLSHLGRWVRLAGVVF